MATNFEAWAHATLAQFAQVASGRLVDVEADLQTAKQGYRYFMQSNAPRLRELLRENTDGLTVAQLSESTGYRADSIANTIGAMQDAYIDRWIGPYRGQWAAVWCVVVPPANCPKPTETK